MSKEAKMMQAMSYRLYDKYGISISPQRLKSVFEDYILEDEIEQLIEAEKEYFEFFQSKVEYIDHIRHPNGIYQAAKAKFEANGTYTYKEGKLWEGKPIIDEYVPNNPDKFTIIIVDHYSLLRPERDDNGSLYNTIGKFSSLYCLKLRDRFGATICGIQQQAATSEEEQFNYGGRSIVEKVKPSAAKLGDNKSTGRDIDLMVSLFHPARYNQTTYEGLDLTEMNDSHRELFINLNRHGVNNAKLQLLFNGACNHFEEIDKKELMSAYYKIKNTKHK